MAQPLKGINILVTRPQGQAKNITQHIHTLGGNAIHLPTIAIMPSDRADQAKQKLAKIKQYSIGIFISSNAVDWTFKLCPQLALQNLRLLSIGNATTTSLSKQLNTKQINTEKIITNPGNNHNDLLQLNILEKQKINGKKIIIFRGQGGNESLRNELLKRGASVDYAEVYSRACPKYSAKTIAEISHTIGTVKTRAIITATSNTSLKNLFTICEKIHQLLQQQQLIIIGHRMLEYALTLGFTYAPIIATKSNDQGIIESIIKWSKTEQEN